MPNRIKPEKTPQLQREELLKKLETQHLLLDFPRFPFFVVEIRGNKKGMARLKSGVYLARKFDQHRGRYEALCQKLGNVTVVRDGLEGDIKDSDMFGINIHKGGLSKTDSIGCQTNFAEQWSSVIQTGKMEAQRYYGDAWREGPIPYILLEV